MSPSPYLFLYTVHMLWMTGDGSMYFTCALIWNVSSLTIEPFFAWTHFCCGLLCPSAPNAWTMKFWSGWSPSFAEDLGIQQRSFQNINYDGWLMPDSLSDSAITQPPLCKNDYFFNSTKSRIITFMKSHPGCPQAGALYIVGLAQGSLWLSLSYQCRLWVILITPSLNRIINRSVQLKLKNAYVLAKMTLIFTLFIYECTQN